MWECQPATPQESEEFPKTGAMVAGCSHVENQEFTTCEPVEPVTCKVTIPFMCIYLFVADRGINYVVHEPLVYVCCSQWIIYSQVWDLFCPN